MESRLALTHLPLHKIVNQQVIQLESKILTQFVVVAVTLNMRFSFGYV